LQLLLYISAICFWIKRQRVLYKACAIRRCNNLIETIRSTVFDQLAIGHRR